jgi:hypothetical protein
MILFLPKMKLSVLSFVSCILLASTALGQSSIQPEQELGAENNGLSPNATSVLVSPTPTVTASVTVQRPANTTVPRPTNTKVGNGSKNTTKDDMPEYDSGVSPSMILHGASYALMLVAMSAVAMF